jgi:hypothetical protein
MSHDQGRILQQIPPKLMRLSSMTSMPSEAAGYSETSVPCTKVYGPTSQRTVICALFRQDVTGIIGNTGLVNSEFHPRSCFFERYPQVGHAPSDKVCQL